MAAVRGRCQSGGEPVRYVPEVWVVSKVEFWELGSCSSWRREEPVIYWTCPHGKLAERGEAVD